MSDAAAFADRLLAWFDVHGRKELPWQQNTTPYRVWVSEVMLQQTQVATVIPYFQRFMAQFPTVRELALASTDEVMHLWTGLGYYARARNLQAAAAVLVERGDGEFPGDIAAVMELPGIGRSTAGAILALSQGQRHPILDGNVKRVLARVFGIGGDPGTRAVDGALWAASEACTPHARVAAYTQAVMDLGATLCTRARPACTVCPMIGICVAAREGRQAELPGAKTRRARAAREVTLLIAQRGVVGGGEGAVLVERRPAAGIWGGLWSPPQFDSEDAALAWCRRELGEPVTDAERLDVIEHAFTHFDLSLRPLRVRCGGVDSGGAGGWGGVRVEAEVGAAGEVAVGPATGAVREDREAERLWYSLATPPRVGLPQPIRQLFERLGARFA